MKLVTIIARVLLGLLFLVTSINGLMMVFTGKGFLPMPPPAGDNAKNFMMALVSSGFMTVVFALQLIGGILLLSGRWLNLGVFVLGPIVANIFLFHLFMDPAGLPVVIVVLGLTLFLAWSRREAWMGVFSQR